MKSHVTTLWLMIALLPIAVSADSTCTHTELWSLPEWFSQTNRIVDPYEISCRLNPFYHRVDFDGDGRQDLAVLITNLKNKKSGIAVVLRASGVLMILGAGIPFDEDDDNFSWLDVWRVESSPVHLNAWKESVPDFRGEVLYLEKSESASGWAGLIDNRFVWYQASD